jgi:methionine biosynthesis protein MetW
MASLTAMGLLGGIKRRAHLLFDPAPMQDFSDFDEYWEQRGELVVYRRWELAAAHIPDGSRVLDIGCGSGDFLRYLKSVKPNIVGVGADSSAKALEMTSRAGFEVMELNAERGPFPDGFDYITAFEVLEHLPEAEFALTSWCAAARKGVLISMPNVGYVGNRIRLMFFGRFPITNCVYHIKEHVRHWTVRDFHEWTERLGLKITSIETQYGLKPFGNRFPSLFAEGIVWGVEAVGAPSNAS